MWSFKNKLVRNGKWIGRKYIYSERYVLPLDANLNISDITVILSRIVEAFGGVDAEIFRNFPEHTKKYFKIMDKTTFDKIYNPDMQIDQDQTITEYK